MVIFSGKNLKTKVNQIGYIDSKLVEGGQPHQLWVRVRL